MTREGWEAEYWRQIRISTVVMWVTLGVLAAIAIATAVLVPLDTAIPYYRRSGRLSMLAMLMPLILPVGMLVQIRKPPKGPVSRAGIVGGWVALWIFVPVVVGMQTVLAHAFLGAAGLW